MTKHDNSKPMGCSKSSSKRKFKQYKSYLKGKKKKTNHQIDNLTSHLNQLEKEEQQQQNQN